MIDPTENARILLVDDDLDLLETLQEQLRCEGFHVTACLSPEAALDAVRATEFATIVSDQHMPNMTGLEFFGRLKECQPLASCVLITGVLALDTVISAINQGDIFRFLAKPWSRAELLATIGNAVQRYRLLTDNARLRADTLHLNRQLVNANTELLVKMEQLIEQKNRLDEANDALNENFDHSLGLCYRIINTFNPLLGARTKATVELCRKMTQTDELTSEEKHVLMASAWLHDIGLVGVDRDILHKFLTRRDECTREDWISIRQHPIYGQTMAAFVDRLNNVGATIRAHHERFDGAGYPDKLGGQAIPWTARCLAVAAGFVETGLPAEKAGDAIVAESGRAYDPDAVRLFFKSTKTSELPRQVRELTLNELRPGMHLARGIFSPAGLLLIPEGQELTTPTIAKIKNHNLLTNVTQRLLVYS
jgi:response regulator RpfG family c-di-GMP phosphodiesterase